MKAIVHTKYGPPDELQLKEVEKPVPGDNEVLIKIHATTVTTTDCNARNFTFVPKSFMFFARIMFGFKKPKINILGIDLAGEIEAIGKDVKLFKVGDQVFGSPGTKFGGHAEYCCVPENGALAIKPADLSWEEAAAISLAGNTALFFIRDLGKNSGRTKNTYPWCFRSDRNLCSSACQILRCRSYRGMQCHECRNGEIFRSR